LQLEQRQSFPALITTQCQVWSCWTYQLRYYSVFAVDTFLYAVTLTFDLEHLQCVACDVMKLYQLNAIEQSAAELLWFQCLTLWPWTCFKCCARLWDDFHQVWPSTTYTCLTYCVFDANLWPRDLELLQHFGCHAFKLNLSEIVKLNNPRLSYWRFSTFSPCNLKGWGRGVRLTDGSQVPSQPSGTPAKSYQKIGPRPNRNKMLSYRRETALQGAL